MRIRIGRITVEECTVEEACKIINMVRERDSEPALGNPAHRIDLDEFAKYVRRDGLPQAPTPGHES